MRSLFSRRAYLCSIGCLGGLTAVSLAQDHDSPQFGIDALTEGAGMVRVPAGEFTMGSEHGNPDEQPAHRVRISKPFEMSRFEVTQAQWQTVFTEAHPKPGLKILNAEGAEVGRTPSHFKGASLPVESVSWDDVQLFLARLNERDPNHTYRLPTEAEWEYASKGGGAAWHKENAGDQTHPVGQKQPNAFGLFDMEGNVAEWVHDWYGREYYQESPHTDPAGPRTGSYRVYRGGSWLDSPKNCRPSFRGFDFPVNRFYNVGFRVVRTGK